MQIQHRFSLIDNIHDIYGIYGAANTRIGLSYGITDRLMIGAGTTKDSSCKTYNGNIRFYSRLKITKCLFHLHTLEILLQL